MQNGLFKIENDVPYDSLTTSRKQQEKQALLNTIILMKTGDSIFISSKILSSATLRKHMVVVKNRCSTKNLVLRNVVEKDVKGARIWCDPKKY